MEKNFAQLAFNPFLDWFQVPENMISDTQSVTRGCIMIKFSETRGPNKTFIYTIGATVFNFCLTFGQAGSEL